MCVTCACVIDRQRPVVPVITFDRDRLGLRAWTGLLSNGGELRRRLRRP
jgi:hypothetical protein